MKDIFKDFVTNFGLIKCENKNKEGDIILWFPKEFIKKELKFEYGKYSFYYNECKFYPIRK